jgi:hypothetical protein
MGQKYDNRARAQPFRSSETTEKGKDNGRNSETTSTAWKSIKSRYVSGLSGLALAGALILGVSVLETSGATRPSPPRFESAAGAEGAGHALLRMQPMFANAADAEDAGRSIAMGSMSTVGLPLYATAADAEYATRGLLPDGLFAAPTGSRQSIFVTPAAYWKCRPCGEFLIVSKGIALRGRPAKSRAEHVSNWLDEHRVQGRRTMMAVYTSEGSSPAASLFLSTLLGAVAGALFAALGFGTSQSHVEPVARPSQLITESALRVFLTGSEEQKAEFHSAYHESTAGIWALGERVLIVHAGRDFDLAAFETELSLLAAGQPVKVLDLR